LRHPPIRFEHSGRRAAAINVPGDLVALARHLQEACLERRLTVAVAESCTGGLVAAAITEVPGSSGYFVGGIVSYSNAAKETLLDVPRTLLEAHGAVSPEVAVAMAMGARARFGSDLAVSVTGVAGPDGGTVEKPVGLVYLGAATQGGTRHQQLQPDHAGQDRAAIREGAAIAALAWLHGLATQGLP
jgi:nicotinamide-nucleotide amidase